MCASRHRCLRSTKKHARRTITIRQREACQALQGRRAEESTPAYASEHRRRAGIEGTISQAVRHCGLRRTRHLGLTKTPLGQTRAATAINDTRVADWLAETPRAMTRSSPFVALMTLS